MNIVKKLSLVFAVGSFFLFASTVLAFDIVAPTTPVAPSIPDAPNMPAVNFTLPTLPELPEVSGEYKDPQKPDIHVHVYVHKLKEDKKARVVQASVCADPDSTAAVPLAGWHLPPTVTYRLNAGSVPRNVGASNLQTIAANSFQVWQNAVGSKVTFTKGANTSLNRSQGDNQNIIAWGRTSSNTLAVTYIRYYVSSGIVTDVDTIFNSRLPWSWTQPGSGLCGKANSYDVQDIMTHENGHWIGLDDTYSPSYVDNTMYGYGSKNEIKKDTLTLGDIVNLSTLYH